MLRNIFVHIFGLRWLKSGSSQKMGNENCRRQWRKLNQQRTFWGSADIVMLKTFRSEFSIQSQFKLCRRSEQQGTGLINARLSHWHNMVQFAVVEKNVLASLLDKLLNCRNGFITTRNCALSSSALCSFCVTEIDESSLTTTLIKRAFYVLVWSNQYHSIPGSDDGSWWFFISAHQKAAKIAVFQISLNLRNSNIFFMLFSLITFNI